MIGYLLKRLLGSVISLIGVLAITFSLMHFAGDPVVAMYPEATPQEAAALRHELGFDDPFPVQFARYMSGVLRGDFGYSYTHKLPALQIVVHRLPATLALVAAAIAVTAIVGVGLGIVAAVRRGSLIDRLITAAASLAQSMPIFWSAILFVLLFAVKLHWLPTSGAGGLRYLILPAASLGLFSIAAVARVTRTAMIECYGEDYVAVARSKGLKESTVTLRHVLRNASLPIVTFLGYRLAEIFGGSVVVEQVFSWPGMGSALLLAAHRRDFPVVQAAVFIMSAWIILVTLIVDLSYGKLDPRVRYD